MKANPAAEVDYNHYARKIKRYEPTYQAMMDDFENTIFGYFYNRRNKDQFIEMLATDGWKYFSVANLNELFSIMVKDHPPIDIEDEVKEPPAIKGDEQTVKDEIKESEKQQVTQPKTKLEEKKAPAAQPKVLQIIEYKEPQQNRLQIKKEKSLVEMPR